MCKDDNSKAYKNKLWEYSNPIKKRLKRNHTNTFLSEWKILTYLCQLINFFYYIKNLLLLKHFEIIFNLANEFFENIQQK